MQIDTRWLTPHPLTVTWWEQRDKCRACRHHLPSVQSARGDPIIGERCSISPREDGGPAQFDYCIDSRLISGTCGPDAAMFMPKE